MDQYSQLRRFGVPGTAVPRYTSYPPAQRFTSDVHSRDYGRWVSQIPPGSEVSIYLHVPFCQRLCWFCSARTQGAPGGAPVAAYVDALMQEIKTLQAALPDGIRASRVCWGGGTPTILSPADIKRLAAALFDAIPLSETAQITVEVDPTEIDDARLDALAAIGMTHAMIGVQDFDPEVQRIIGRAQSFEDTRTTVEGLRARGIAELSVGLLYGLPRQSPARLALTTQMALSLAPDRVAVQCYAHAPAIARRQSLIPTDDLPTPNGQVQLFDVARKVLEWDGFKSVGIDHFALPSDPLAKASEAGTLRRSFQGYSDDTNSVLLGLGASAISRLPQGYAQNSPSTAAYLKAVQVGGFATSRGHRLGREDALRGRMIEMILCDFRVDTARLSAEGHGPSAQVTTLLDRLLNRFEGHVARTPEGVAIRARSTGLARVIAQELDAYSQA